MNLIVAVDQNWGIGWHDRLLFRIREDMKRIKALTTGKVIIVGRRTLQTFPGGQPLPDRLNVVLTRQPELTVAGARIVHDLAELADNLAGYAEDDVYILGGSSVYRQLLPYCRRAYVTRVEIIQPADSHFPNLGELAGWRLDQEETLLLPGVIHAEKQDEPAELCCHFCQYVQDEPRLLPPAGES
jgi:dihydrofolate reductase